MSDEETLAETAIYPEHDDQIVSLLALIERVAHRVCDRAIAAALAQKPERAEAESAKLPHRRYASAGGFALGTGWAPCSCSLDADHDVDATLVEPGPPRGGELEDVVKRVWSGASCDVTFDEALAKVRAYGDRRAAEARRKALDALRADGRHEAADFLEKVI